MEINSILLVVIQLIVSYFFFQLHIKLKINPILEKDEFTSFKRKNVHTSAGLFFFILFTIYLIFNSLLVYNQAAFPKNFLFFIFACLFCCLLGFFDDKKSIDPKIRLVAQIILIYFSLTTVPHILDYLPIKISIFLSIVIWIYLINITNFVDGADGFCSVIALSFFFQIIIINYLLNINLFSHNIALAMIPILLVFLIFFNRPAAKLFMGDSGSVFLGFLIGYCVIEFSYYGYFFFAISSFSYPIIDCSITLLKKILRGYAPWERLGDYYFLMPKKRTRKLDFLAVEKKILFCISIVSLFQILITYIGINYNLTFLIALNFISSFLLIKIFNHYKK